MIEYEGRKYKTKKDLVTALRYRAELWDKSLRDNKKYMKAVVKAIARFNDLGLGNVKKMIEADVMNEDLFIDWLVENNLINIREG